MGIQSPLPKRRQPSHSAASGTQALARFGSVDAKKWTSAIVDISGIGGCDNEPDEKDTEQIEKDSVTALAALELWWLSGMRARSYGRKWRMG
jgi:hypothetical protein